MRQLGQEIHRWVETHLKRTYLELLAQNEGASSVVGFVSNEPPLQYFPSDPSTPRLFLIFWITGHPLFWRRVERLSYILLPGPDR